MGDTSDCHTVEDVLQERAVLLSILLSSLLLHSLSFAENPLTDREDFKVITQRWGNNRDQTSSSVREPFLSWPTDLDETSTPSGEFVLGQQASSDETTCAGQVVCLNISHGSSSTCEDISRHAEDSRKLPPPARTQSQPLSARMHLLTSMPLPTRPISAKSLTMRSLVIGFLQARLRDKQNEVAYAGTRSGRVFQRGKGAGGGAFVTDGNMNDLNLI